MNTDQSQNVIINILLIICRSCGAICSIYFSILGLMLIIGGPDGNADIEARAIGGGYLLFGATCSFCSLAKKPFLLKNSIYFIAIFLVLLIPAVYVLTKDQDAFIRIPSAYLGYFFSIIVFSLVQFIGDRSNPHQSKPSSVDRGDQI